MTSKTTPKTPDDHDAFRRFGRTHSILRPPRFSAWHGLLLGLLCGLFFGQQRAPGLLADIGALHVSHWDASVLVQVTILLLMFYAMFLVRGLHWLSYSGLILAGTGLCLRLGEVRITHEPLTLGFALILASLAVLTVRIITRQPDMATRGKYE